VLSVNSVIIENAAVKAIANGCFDRKKLLKIAKFPLKVFEKSLILVEKKMQEPCNFHSIPHKNICARWSPWKHTFASS
jgi:hypothetical protein